MKKNIEEYWEKYQEIYSFDEVILQYRQKNILDFLELLQPKNILEIGCGFQPLFLQYENFENFTIVEPGKNAFKNAQVLSEQKNKIICINNFFEDIAFELINKEYDCIIISGVLHETSTPRDFLKKLGELMTPNTNVYVDVPNALSLHRIIAKEMGIIKNYFEKSDRNKSLKQNKVFDKELLVNSIKENIKNVIIKECYSFFIKPFTHDQMMNCLNHQIINQNIIEGLFKSSEVLKEYGCELCCIFKKDY